MQCPHCKVTITSRTGVCPLCHVPFNNKDGLLTRAERLPRAFAPRDKASLFSTVLFDRIYWLTAVSMLIIMAALELSIAHRFRISLFAAAITVYVYVFIRYTILDKRYLSQKIVMQAIFLSVIFIIANRTVLNTPIIFEYILPTIYMVALIAIVAYIIINHKYPQKYLLNLMTVAVLSFLPIGVIYFTEAQNKLPSIIVAASGGVSLVTMLIFGAKKIGQEFVRLFHF